MHAYFIIPPTTVSHVVIVFFIYIYIKIISIKTICNFFFHNIIYVYIIYNIIGTITRVFMPSYAYRRLYRHNLAEIQTEFLLSPFSATIFMYTFSRTRIIRLISLRHYLYCVGHGVTHTHIIIYIIISLYYTFLCNLGGEVTKNFHYFHSFFFFFLKLRVSKMIFERYNVRAIDIPGSLPLLIG